jgi:hypothetical protein
MRLSLFKWTYGPWEKARGFVHKDLELIETSLNRLLSQTFDGNNNLLAIAIQGDPTIVPQYVSNTGTPNNAPKWDKVDLIAGVQKRLQFIHFVSASKASVLVGRGDSGPGDFQEIELGPGLSMTGTTMDATGGGGSLVIALSVASLRA